MRHLLAYFIQRGSAGNTRPLDLVRDTRSLAQQSVIPSHPPSARSLVLERPLVSLPAQMSQPTKTEGTRHSPPRTCAWSWLRWFGFGNTRGWAEVGRLQSKGKCFGHQRGRKARDMRVCWWYRDCFWERLPSTGKRSDVLVTRTGGFSVKDALVHTCSSWLIICRYSTEPPTQRLLSSLNHLSYFL